MERRMWSRDKLAELVEKRRQGLAQLPKAEDAVLAYARWQGLTAEDNVDRDAAKEALDRICDETEPEEWSRLKDLVGGLDDEMLKGLMRYTLTRSLGQLRHQQRDYAQQSEETPELPEPNRPRTRSRSR
jgi:hypothetical protein